MSGTELWHRAPHSWLTPCPSLRPCLSPGAGGSPGSLGCLLPTCAPVEDQRPAAGKGLIWGALVKGRGCFWLGEMSSLTLSQHLPINQIERRPVASPGNPRPSLTLTELSLPDVTSEKQVPDVTCLIIFPFPKDKAPCSSCTEGRVDTCGGTSELCFALTADGAH